MATWKVTMAMALAGVMAAGPAFAQATMSRGHKMGGGTGMDQERVKAAQQALKDKGHDPGDVDGRMGPRTQQALRDFQKAQGLQATGRLDSKTLQSLGVEGGRTSSAGESSTSGSASPSTGSSTGGAADASSSGASKK